MRISRTNSGRHPMAHSFSLAYLGCSDVNDQNQHQRRAELPCHALPRRGIFHQARAAQARHGIAWEKLGHDRESVESPHHLPDYADHLEILNRKHRRVNEKTRKTNQNNRLPILPPFIQALAFTLAHPLLDLSYTSSSCMSTSLVFHCTTGTPQISLSNATSRISLPSIWHQLL